MNQTSLLLSASVASHSSTLCSLFGNYDNTELNIATLNNCFLVTTSAPKLLFQPSSPSVELVASPKVWRLRVLTQKKFDKNVKFYPELKY